jgi:hypothetical protein
MSKGTLDHETLQAVGVLMRAVEQARVPGVLEFRYLVDALDRTLVSGDVEELDEAKRFFEALDSDSRARVVDCAHDVAHATAAANRAGDAEPAGKRKPLRRAAKSATGFLAALNGARGAVANPPDSSVTAKSRLLAAVEERRENDLAATQLFAGDPLPRAN